MSEGINGSSFIVGYLMGRRRRGEDLLAITPGTPSTLPSQLRWIIAAAMLIVGLGAGLLWWDLATAVGWLRVVVLALALTGAGNWVVETVWDRRRATFDPAEPSRSLDAGQRPQ